MLIENEMPPLPDFLNRSVWSTEQWEAHAEADKRFQKALTRKAHNDRRKLAQVITAHKVERLERQARKDERKALREARRARRALRQRSRDTVLRMLDQGHDTIGQMSKVSGEKSSALKRALHWLLKNERIKKITPRRYGR